MPPPPGLRTRSLALLSLVIGFGLWLSAAPAGAELTDTPANGWGVDTLIQPTSTNVRNHVWAIEQVGNTMYVGGAFADVKSPSGTTFSQPYLAAFHADTGRWLDWWRPQIDGSVLSLQASPDGSRLYIGGEFSNVNGQARSGLAALNPATGQLVPGFDTQVFGGVVRAMKSLNGQLYLGGSFTSIRQGANSVAVTRAARISINNGAIDGSWRPLIQGGGVWDIEPSPTLDRVYLAGFFDSVGGNTAYADFATVRKTNGAPVGGLTFRGNSANPDFNYQQAIAVAGGNVFVGGSQHNVTVYRESDFALVAHHYTNRQSFEPNTGPRGGDIQDFEVVGNRVYVACHCYAWVWSRYDGVIYGSDASTEGIAPDAPVRAVFALNASDGRLDTGFASSFTGVAGVWAMKGASDGCLWSGGDTTTSAGSPTRRVVRLCDSAGPGPAPAPQLTAPAPASCAARIVNGAVVLTWQPVPYADDWVIRRNGFVLTRVTNPSTLTFTDTNVSPTASYTYTVATFSGGNNSNPPRTCNPNPVDLGAVNAPVMPATCSTSVVNGSARVSWTRSAGDNATDFVLHRRRNGGTWFWRAKVPASTTVFTDANVAAGSSYEYRVLTQAGSVNSAFRICSGAATIPTVAPSAPLPPSACTAASGTNSASVSWTRAANDNGSDFVIHRRRNGGAWFWRAKVAAPTTSFTDANIASGSTYQYRVRTQDGSTVSGFTNCSGTVSIGGGGGGGPVAPASCVANRVGSTATVTWTRAANDNANQFIVQRSRNGGTWFWAGAVNAPATSFTNTGLNADSSYAYRVKTRAGSDSGFTPCSGGGGGGGGGPVAPASCSVSLAGTTATVTWNRAANDSAQRFVVERARNGGAWFWAGRVDAPATSFTNTGLGAGTFTYRIRTQSGGVNSAPTTCSPGVTV